MRVWTKVWIAVAVVSTLVGLLDTRDERTKRLTANDAIGHFLKRRELVDLEERIERIEERLETRG